MLQYPQALSPIPVRERDDLVAPVVQPDFGRGQQLLGHTARFEAARVVQAVESSCRRASHLRHHIECEESARSSPKVSAGMLISFSSAAVTWRTKKGFSANRRAPSARASSMVLKAPMSSL